MTRKIKTTEATLPPLRDIGLCLPRVDPARVQEALGAVPANGELEKALAPITLAALREELFRRLQSSGGRPGLSGASRRAKIPLSDEQWLELEKLAAAVAAAGFAPSAGQVASVLLALSLHSVASRMERTEVGQSAALVKELAALAAAESESGQTKRQ